MPIVQKGPQKIAACLSLICFQGFSPKLFFNGVCDELRSEVDLHLLIASSLLNARNPQGSATALSKTAGFSEWLAFLLPLILL